MRSEKWGYIREEIFSEVDDPTPSTDETDTPRVEELWVGDEEGQGVLISRNGIAIMRGDEIVINITPDGYIIVTGDDDEEELADTQRVLVITKGSISYMITPKDE